MTTIKFIKDHPSKRFKDGDHVDIPTEGVDAWLKSGYAVLLNDAEDILGNVPSSSNGGEESESKSSEQSKFGNVKKKKRAKK